jgi:hypothetical protein
LDPWWTSADPDGAPVRPRRTALGVALGHLCCAWIREKGFLENSDEALEDRQQLFSLLRTGDPGHRFPQTKTVSDFAEKLLSWTVESGIAWQLKQELESESGQALLLVMLAQHGSKNAAVYCQQLQGKLECMGAAEWQQVLDYRPFVGLERLLRVEPAVAKRAADKDTRVLQEMSAHLVW